MTYLLSERVRGMEEEEDCKVTFELGSYHEEVCYITNDERRVEYHCDFNEELDEWDCSRYECYRDGNEWKCYRDYLYEEM